MLSQFSWSAPLYRTQQGLKLRVGDRDDTRRCLVGLLESQQIGRFFVEIDPRHTLLRLLRLVTQSRLRIQADPRLCSARTHLRNQLHKPGADTGRAAIKRSEERRVGQECVSTGRSRWSP